MKHSFFFLLLICIVPQNSVVYAVSDGMADGMAGGISKEEAVSIARQHNPGRVLAVKKKANVYQVKTLSENGKVRVIRIDAINGRINPRASTNANSHR